MSCILVGLGTLRLDPNNLSSIDIALTTTRDILLTAWHSILLYYGTISSEKQCIRETNVLSWLYFDILICLLRLLKNPLQYVANKKLQGSGQNWNNPSDFSNSWVRFFAANRGVCQMRLYTFIDWMSYFSWILGAWAVHPLDGCSKNWIVLSGYLEISISTLIYVFFIGLYILSYAAYKFSEGRWCPGLVVQNNMWPDSCPRISWDRRLWRQHGESIESYRLRVREHWSRTSTIVNPPVPLQSMSLEERNLTEEELRTLRTIRFQLNRKIVTLQPNSVKIGESLSKDDNQIVGKHDRTTDDTCALCLEDYVEDEILRELHCGHRYHAECVDEWLTQTKRTCPVCNQDAVGKVIESEP